MRYYTVEIGGTEKVAASADGKKLFVLPQFQGRGYGRLLLDFCEKEIAKGYDEVVIDASLSAKGIYLKRGYRESEYHIITTENGDHLCYDVMKKQIKK